MPLVRLVSDGFVASVLGPNFAARRLDSGESIFVERALLFIEAQPYNTLVPPMKGRLLVPTDNSSHPGASHTVYRRYTRTGVARMITGRGQELPTVGLFVQEDSHRFFAVGAAYEYSYFDLLAVGMALANGQTINLDLELSIAAREAIEKKFDIIAGLGTASAALTYSVELEEDAGLLGLLNLPNARSYTPAVGAALGTAWSTKTPDEVLADLNGIVGDQVASTYEVHIPDTLIVPPAQREQQLTRSMGDGRSDSIETYFLKVNPHIKKIESWMYCAGIGAGSSDVMVCYKRDPRMVRHMISMEATTLPPQQKDLMTRVPVIAKTAGVVSPYPLSVSIGAGI